MKLCKKQKFLASRLQRPVGAWNDVIAKKLRGDCFKTLADDPKTGLLAARAISSVYVLYVRFFGAQISKNLDRCVPIRHVT